MSQFAKNSHTLNKSTCKAHNLANKVEKEKKESGFDGETGLSGLCALLDLCEIDRNDNNSKKSNKKGACLRHEFQFIAGAAAHLLHSAVRDGVKTKKERYVRREKKESDRKENTTLAHISAHRRTQMSSPADEKETKMQT